MTNKEASLVKIPFGKYKGQAIDSVASSDNGLRYLDWLYDQRQGSSNFKEFNEALDIYMNDPSIKEEIRRL